MTLQHRPVFKKALDEGTFDFFIYSEDDMGITLRHVAAVNPQARPRSEVPLGGRAGGHPWRQGAASSIASLSCPP